MTTNENAELYAWIPAIRELYCGSGVRRVSDNSYETYIKADGKPIGCGTYKTESQAIEAVLAERIRLFAYNIIAFGDDPSKVVESVEKGYFVSEKGNIYNKHGKLMKGGVNRCGYRQAVLNGKTHSVHRVVAETFIQNKNHLPCVNHKDGNKLNNSIGNLEWCTYSYNTFHAYQNGLETIVCGEKHHNHKLTEKDVAFIRQTYSTENESCVSTLAELLNVHRTTIWDVIKGKTWRKDL